MNGQISLSPLLYAFFHDCLVRQRNVSAHTIRSYRDLRAQGVAANATERAVRGESRSYKIDGIYRAERRGESTHTSQRSAQVVRELLNGDLRVEPGKAKLLHTRSEVERGWRAMNDILLNQGDRDLGANTRRFLDQMPRVRTEKELLAQRLRNHLRDTPLRNQLHR